MKKLIIVIILISFTSKGYACSCSPVKLIDRYALADFVGTVKILNSVKDTYNPKTLNISVKTINFYKGEQINSLKIYLNESMCNVYLPINSDWLIFATKDKNGELTFGYCSGQKQLNRKYDINKYPNLKQKRKQSIKLKTEVLTFLKNNEINPVNEFNLKYSSKTEAKNKLKGYKIIGKRFALYELTVNKNLEVENVNSISEFQNNELSKQMLKFIKDDLIFGTKKIKTIPKSTKIIVSFYFYPSENGNQSFISFWDL